MNNRYVNSFREALVASNTFAALYAVSICLVTLFLTDRPFLLILPLTVFSGTLLIYTMNRYTDRSEDAINNPLRFQYLYRYGEATLLIAVGIYLICLFFLFRLKPATFFIALLPIFIAIFYSVIRLKRVFLIKNISVSVGILCAVLIVLVTFNDFTIFSLLLILFLFPTFLINTIIFDIKDIEGDTRYNINTIPSEYGLKITKMVCYTLLLLSVLFIPALISFTQRSYLLLVYVLYIGLYITFADNPGNLPLWYYGIFVDGESLFLCAWCGVFAALNMVI